MKAPINEPRIRLLVASAALVALTSCCPPSGVHDSDVVHGQSGGMTGNRRGGPAGSPASGARLMLRDGWQVQTSSGQPEGAAISKAGFAASGWYPTAVPATVSGVLAQAGVYPDPFFGTNFRAWPGMGRGRRRIWPSSGTPQNNPFSVGWWFRTEFDLPAEMAGRAITLALRGCQLPRGRLAQWRADRRLQSGGWSHAPFRLGHHQSRATRREETRLRC